MTPRPMTATRSGFVTREVYRAKCGAVRRRARCGVPLQGQGFANGGCYRVDVGIGQGWMHREGQYFAGHALGDRGPRIAVAEALVEGLAVNGGGIEDGRLDAALAESCLELVTGFAACEDADGVLVPHVTVCGDLARGDDGLDARE